MRLPFFWTPGGLFFQCSDEANFGELARQPFFRLMTRFTLAKFSPQLHSVLSNRAGYYIVKRKKNDIKRINIRRGHQSRQSKYVL